MIRSNLIASVLAVALALTSAHAQQVPIPTTAAEVPGPAAGTAMSKEYIQTVGRMAYLWGWPLVNSVNRSKAFAEAPEPGLLGGVVPVAFNRNAMLTSYIKPDQHFVTCTNQDVVYGAGYMALDKEPIVFQVPDFGDRFWVYAHYDARTDEFSEIGKQYGTKPGFYLMVGPNWKGEKPAGITAVVRSSTSLAFLAPRVFMDDTDADHKAIQPLISQVVYYPLSEFDGKMKTKDWSKLPDFPAPKAKGETKWVNPETFFDELPEVMKQVPPMPGEEALYNWIGSVLDAAAKDPEIKKTLKETAIAAERELIDPYFQWRNNGRPAGNGWNSPVNGAKWGTDYANRTATAKSNMYDNSPQETKYIYTDDDSAGRQLNGQNNYTITFAKVPPVKGFWSLTLYNDVHMFNPNALNRYSLGTKNKDLKFDPDGSLTLYAGTKSPGKDKESNWLPAPEGTFSLYIRAYWADKGILDGTWLPPKIEIIEKVGAQAQDKPPVGRSEPQGGQPPRVAKQSVPDLDEQVAYQRSFEAVLWAMPASAIYRLRVGLLEQPGMADNVITAYSGPLHTYHEVITGNQVTPYIAACSDLRKGPVVLEVPAKTDKAVLYGQVVDAWQATIADVGPSGEDKGKGGKYLFLPPGYKDRIPDGYFPVRSSSYRILFAFRSIQLEGATVADAYAYSKTLKMYPLSEATDPKPTKYTDGRSDPLHTLPYYDIRALRDIHDIISVEPVQPRDKVMMGMLATIGIEPGKPFNPPEKLKAAMEKGVVDAYYYMQKLDTKLFASNLYWPDRHWSFVMVPDEKRGFEFVSDDDVQIDERAAAWFFFTFYPKVLSDRAGTVYLAPIADSDGNPLEANKTYKLRVPKDIPAKQFWSLTVYDRATWAFIPNKLDRAGLGSFNKDRMKVNDDGSVDLYFGPKAPADLESNWIPTMDKEPYVWLRLYGPEEAFWKKTFKMPDVELVK